MLPKVYEPTIVESVQILQLEDHTIFDIDRLNVSRCNAVALKDNSPWAKNKTFPL